MSIEGLRDILQKCMWSDFWHCCTGWIQL